MNETITTVGTMYNMRNGKGSLGEEAYNSLSCKLQNRLDGFIDKFRENHDLLRYELLVAKYEAQKQQRKALRISVNDANACGSYRGGDCDTAVKLCAPNNFEKINSVERKAFDVYVEAHDALVKVQVMIGFYMKCGARKYDPRQHDVDVFEEITKTWNLDAMTIAYDHDDWKALTSVNTQ